MTRSISLAIAASLFWASSAFAQTNEDADISASPSAEQTVQEGQSEQTDPVAPPITPEQKQAALDAWAKIYEVFSHPRCANCHTEDEWPRWSGPNYGELARLHGMNVQRGPDGFGNPGMTCQTCHGESNSAKLHGPPGAPHWHLAPASMVWWQKSTSEVCEQVKDPQRNGDRTLAEIADHVKNDALVLWGWAPGPGREPAPGSAEETFALLQTWIAGDAPCPQG